jgi:hypothetical protein
VGRLDALREGIPCFFNVLDDSPAITFVSGFVAGCRFAASVGSTQEA